MREYRRSNQKWTIQRIWQNRVHNTKMHTKQKHCTICIGHHDTKASTNNVNKTYVLLQPTGGKDEPKIVFMRKSQRTSQHVTQSVKTHNREKQKLERWATQTQPEERDWTQMLVTDKQFLLLIRHRPCYSYIQSSPVKVLAVIEERKPEDM
jgi:hypothetical protein